MNPLSPFECVLPTRGCSDPSYALAASLPGDRSHRSPSGESLCVVPPLPPSLFRSRPDGRFNPRAPPRAGHVPHSPPHSVSSPGRGGGSPSAAGGDDLCPHPISAGPHPSSGPIPPANSLCPLCRRGSISPVPFLHRCSYAPCSACPFCLREHAGLFLRALPMPVPFRPPWWGPLRRGAMCHPLHPVAVGWRADTLFPATHSVSQCLRATSRSPRGVISLISLRYPCVPMPTPLPSVCVAPSLSSIPPPVPPPRSAGGGGGGAGGPGPRLGARAARPPPPLGHKDNATKSKK